MTSKVPEQRYRNALQQKANYFARMKQEMTQEMTHWGNEILISQRFQRENVEKCQLRELELNAIANAATANVGGNSKLQEQVEQQIEEIRILIYEIEEQRVPQIRKDREKKSEVNQLRGGSWRHLESLLPNQRRPQGNQETDKSEDPGRAELTRAD